MVSRRAHAELPAKLQQREIALTRMEEDVRMLDLRASKLGALKEFPVAETVRSASKAGGGQP